MVSVAQLVEPRIVIPVVVGSSPIVHPKMIERTRYGSLAQLVEQLTLNQRVVGSIPTRPTIPEDLLAEVAKLVDALALEASAARRVGSSPSFRTSLVQHQMVS